jgi:hypothetical protein
MCLQGTCGYLAHAQVIAKIGILSRCRLAPLKGFHKRRFQNSKETKTNLIELFKVEHPRHGY